MLEINDTCLQAGWITGHIRYPQPSVTFVLKCAFDLVHNDVVRVASGRIDLEDDVYSGEDLTGSLWYSSDFAYYKPKADVLLVGQAHSPGERPTDRLTVSFQVGSLRRSLYVIGDRELRRVQSGWSLTKPVPFTTKNLTYENSFGGPRYELNPVGKGYIPEDTGVIGTTLAAHNIEYPGQPIDDFCRVTGAPGFSPLPLGWPQRRSKTGTFDERYLKTRWPWFPEDFEWTFYNSAPEEQQVSGYLAGDEILRFENLHPKIAIYESRLLGLRPRCFYSEVSGAPTNFIEVPLVLDTLWANVDRERLVLVWRGNVDISRETMGDQDQFLIACEKLAEPPKPISFYDVVRREMTRVLLAGPSAEDENAEVEAFDQDATVFTASHGETDSVAREWCLAELAKRGNLEELDLTGVDLSDLNLQGVSFRGSVLTRSSFRKACLASTKFDAAILSEADFTDADLKQASLKNSDCVKARFVRAKMQGACLAGADCSRANFRYADLRDLIGEGTILEYADLFRVQGNKAVLDQALLAHSSLHEADFSDASFVNASLEGASAFPICAQRANLTGLRATGAVLWSADFRNVKAPLSIWQETELKEANFNGAHLAGAEFDGALLQDANFEDACLRKARLPNSNLSRANLRNADLLKSSLEQADLTEANLTGANLFEAETIGAQFTDATLESANLGRTTLQR